jgi:hypothetical protein
MLNHPPSKLEILKRSTQRMSISVPYELQRRLQCQADLDGRSLSNLCAFLLELSASKMFPKEH